MANTTEEVLREYEKATDNSGTKQRVVSDYSRFDPREGVQKVVNEEKTEHVRKKENMSRAKLPFTSILLYFVIAGFAMLLLNSYVKLTVLTRETAEQTTEYEKLQTEYVKLQAESEQQYNLSEIEDYAVNVLGMTKVEAEQIETIELDAEESITVIKDEDETTVSGILEDLLEKIRSVVEFLT